MKLGAAGSAGARRPGGNSPDNAGTGQHRQMAWVRQAGREGVHEEPASERLSPVICSRAVNGLFPEDERDGMQLLAQPPRGRSFRPSVSSLAESRKPGPSASMRPSHAADP